MESEKVTKGRSRWYDDACGTALAMELVGERWSLLIARELMFGPRRFSELRAGLPGISANVLTQRLDGMQRASILRRVQMPPPANVQVYELTPWGYGAEEAIIALGRWAAQSPDHNPMLFFSAASMMLSLRTLLDRVRAREMRMTVGFRFGRDSFVARLDHGELPIVRAPAEGDVVFDTDPRTMANTVYGKRPIADAEAAGTMVFHGNRDAAQAFIGLFHLPVKADRVPAAG